MLTLSRVLVLLLVITACLGCNRERNESIRHMNAGLQAFKGKQIPSALKLLRKATEVDPTNDRAFFYTGLIQYQRGGNLEGGLKNISEARKLNDQDYEYAYHQGVIHAKKEQWKAAADLFQQAIKLKPDHAESHLRMGRAYDRMEKYDAAQQAYAAAIKANPRLPEAYNALGGLYLRFEKYSHAAHVLKNAVENNPSFAQNFHDLGLTYQAQKRYDDAIKQFTKTLDLEPGNTGAVFNLGMTYAANKQPREAMKRLNAYLTRRSGAEDQIRVRIAEETLSRIEQAARSN